MADLRAELWVKLQELPKPITEVQVIKTVNDFLPQLEASQFRDWFDHNGTHLLSRLNGG